MVDGYVLEKHVSSIFGHNIRYEDESDYSEKLVNIYQSTGRHISVRFSNVKFVKLAAERSNLRGLVNIVIIIQFPYKTNNFLIIKATISFPITIGKAVPLQAWRVPEGSRKLRFPDFIQTAQEGGKVVNLKHRPPLPPGNSLGTHFC